jgi:hypothetical protein
MSKSLIKIFMSHGMLRIDWYVVTDDSWKVSNYYQ